jgi:predicted nucleic acid-binding protein
MTAVADTTPLNYLILIGAVEVIPQLYGRVLIPRAVMDELRHDRTPALVRDWVAHPPPWLETRPVTVPADPSLWQLEAGECEAIALAQEVGAGILVIDELDGRKEAARHGLNITGTLGVLNRAAEHGLLDFRTAVQSLKGTTFHMTDALLQAFLDRHPLREP